MHPIPDIGVSDEIRLVEDFIRETVRSEEPLLSEIAAYVIEAGGKRLRPAVTLLAFKSVGGEDVRAAVELAAAFELIHSATLIHDDINDGGTMRRGRTAAYKQYGILNALVTGDFLFTKAFQIGGRFGEDIVTVTADTCSRLAEGEIRQKRNLHNVGLSAEEYFDIIARKTAGPISAGGRIGAMVAGGSSGQVEALASYGLNLGIAFQIMDDILDVTGDATVLGKGSGSDLSEGNVTLLTIQALLDAPPDERVELARIVGSPHTTPEDIETAIRIIIDSGAVESARDEARRYADAAREAVSSRTDIGRKDVFETLISFVLTRDH